MSLHDVFTTAPRPEVVSVLGLHSNCEVVDPGNLTLPLRVAEDSIRERRTDGKRNSSKGSANWAEDVVRHGPPGDASSLRHSRSHPRKRLLRADSPGLGLVSA